MIGSDHYFIRLDWHDQLVDSGAVALGFPWSWTVFYVVTNGQ